MTPAQFAKLAPFDRVEVFSFGRHPGVVVEKVPTITIQGRTFADPARIRVRLDDGREWSGHFRNVTFRAPRSLRGESVIDSLESSIAELQAAVSALFPVAA